MQSWILRRNPEIKNEPAKGHDSPAMMRSSHTTHTERTQWRFTKTRIAYTCTQKRVVE